jgi:hypothetical protein|tara:strand:+ start:587 stop:775 length:189 start_codon:yes stop_codon:yes gene_type:complete
MGPVPGVKRGIVFEGTHCPFDDLKRAAARPKKVPAGLKRLNNPFPVRVHVSVRDVPGSSVNS